jgi:hypothetical protein
MEPSKSASMIMYCFAPVIWVKGAPDWFTADEFSRHVRDGLPDYCQLYNRHWGWTKLAIHIAADSKTASN